MSTTNQRATNNKATTRPPLERRSASQILSDILQEKDNQRSSKTSDTSVGTSSTDTPQSAKHIALRSRFSHRRVSFDDVTFDNMASRCSEDKRRSSYNDAIPSTSSKVSSVAGRHLCTRGTRRRVSFSDESEPSDQERELFRSAAGKYAQSASRSRRLQQTRRRKSYSDALAYSWEPIVKVSSAEEARRRRASYNDALDADDDDEEYGASTSPRPQRRVSFSDDPISSVREIPTISKLERRQLFYRKREIKQFRLDSWREQACVIADLHKETKCTAPPPPRRSSNSSTGTTCATRRPTGTGDIEVKSEGKIQAQQKRTAKPKEAKQQAQVNKSLSSATRNQTRQQISARYSRSISSSSDPGGPFFSDSCFTASEVSAAPTNAEVSPYNDEEKQQDWTFQVCARARIEARVRPNAAAAAAPASSPSRSGTGRRFVRRNSIEAVAA